MDCDKAIHRIYNYLDGELTVWRRWAISRHLDDCPPCAHGFDFEIELRQVIASKCRDEVPPDLKRRIAAALGEPLLDEPGAAAGPADTGTPNTDTPNTDTPNTDTPNTDTK